MAMRYMKIQLDKLDTVRAATHSGLKQLEASTGKRYSIRTFYLGPRRGPQGRQGTTNKADAYAAKIAIYEEKDYRNLVAYV
jgi:hypothetical protein